MLQTARQELQILVAGVVVAGATQGHLLVLKAVAAS
jgi:hypothetical protein